MTTLIDTQPAIVPPGPSRPPVVARRRLQSGLEVATCHFAGRPFVVANVTFQRGTQDDAHEYMGATGMMASLWNRATTSRSFEELGSQLDALAAGVGGGAGDHVTTLGLDAPIWNIAEAFEIFGDVLRNPSFPDKEFQKDLEGAKAGNQGRHFNAGLLGGYSVMQELFTDDTTYTYEANWPVDALGRIDIEQLRELHRLTLDAPATLLIAGDIEAIDVDALAAKLGDAWAEPRDRAPGKVERREGGRRIVVIDRPNSPQSVINAGHEGPGANLEDPVPLETFLNIFGAGPDNWLNKVLREERGYTYGITVGLTRWRHGGMLNVNTSVETDATAESIGEIVRLMEKARDEGVTSEELEKVRNARLGSEPLVWQHANTGLGYLGAVIEQDLPLDHLAKMEERLRTHTVDDVNALAATLMKPDDLVIIVVGDADKIVPGLEALELGPVSVRKPEDVFPPPPQDATIQQVDSMPPGAMELGLDQLLQMPPETRAQILAQMPPELLAQLPPDVLAQLTGESKAEEADPDGTEGSEGTEGK